MRIISGDEQFLRNLHRNKDTSKSSNSEQQVKEPLQIVSQLGSVEGNEDQLVSAMF